MVVVVGVFAGKGEVIGANVGGGWEENKMGADLCHLVREEMGEAYAEGEKTCGSGEAMPGIVWAK